MNNNMNITIFSTHGFEQSALLTANNQRYRLHFQEARLTLETVALAQHSECISLFVNDDCSAPVLEALSDIGVRYIALRSAGYNHVHLPTAHRLGIQVARVPAYSPYAVAEHALALMLTLNRKIHRAHNRVREMNFSLEGLTGFDMHGKTVGIVGTGKIGAVAAKILHGFGCSLLGFDPYPSAQLTQEYGMRYTDIQTLCAESDIITLHAPLMESTKYIINAETIGLMKRGAMLINTSRGGLVESRAVITALKTGHLGAVGLDVYEDESGLFFEDHSATILQDDVIARLMSFPNVLITSHQAFLTDTALQNIADTTFENISAWAEGKSAPHTVE
jgi:D-lactate dehydrogenase